MKKILLVLLTFFIIIAPVEASTNTYHRTNEDLRVPKKIKYKSNMEESVLSTPSVDALEKIYDFAELLTDEEEQELYDKVQEFIKTTNLDLALVTTNSNHKVSTKAYADDFYDYNDFKINGLVFVIDMVNRQFYISTAGTAMLYYDDERIESILTALDEPMLNQEFFQANKDFITETLNFYNEGYSDNANKYVVIGTQIYHKTPYLTLTIIATITSTVVLLVLALKNKQVKLASNSNDYFVANSLKITDESKVLTSTHTTKTYNTTSSGSDSDGGFSSGSSESDHGGGGHSF